MLGKGKANDLINDMGHVQEDLELGEGVLEFHQRVRPRP